MNWLRAFFSGDEARVDSIIALGAFALISNTAFTLVQVICSPAAFSPGAFAGSAASIIGAVAAGKTVRDCIAPNQGRGSVRDPVSGEQPLKDTLR